MFWLEFGRKNPERILKESWKNPERILKEWAVLHRDVGHLFEGERVTLCRAALCPRLTKEWLKNGTECAHCDERETSTVIEQKKTVWQLNASRVMENIIRWERRGFKNQNGAETIWKNDWERVAQLEHVSLANWNVADEEPEQSLATSLKPRRVAPTPSRLQPSLTLGCFFWCIEQPSALWFVYAFARRSSFVCAETRRDVDTVLLNLQSRAKRSLLWRWRFFFLFFYFFLYIYSIRSAVIRRRRVAAPNQFQFGSNTLPFDFICV